MDVSAVKAKNLVDAAGGSKPTKNTAEQLLGDFSAAVAERIKVTSTSAVDSSKSGLVGALTAKPDVKPEAPSEPKTIEAAPREDHQPRERAEAPAKDTDNYVAPAGTKDTSQHEASQQDSARSETTQDGPDNDAPTQEQGQSNDREASGNDKGDQGEQVTQDSADSEGGEAINPAAEATANQTQDVLAAVTEIVNQNATTGKGDEKQVSLTNGEKAQNIAVAQGNANAGGDDQAALNLASDKAAQKSNTANAGQQQAQTQANLSQKTDGAHTLNSDAALKQQQAADLASKVGSDQKMNVNVTVTKQSEQLVSQPTSSLGAQAAIADDANTTTQTATQAAAKTAAPGPQVAPTHNLGNQTGQQQGSDAQQQAQQQLQMAQAEAAKNVTAGDAKSQAAQTASNHAAGATTKIGGAEGMSNAQGVTQSNTAQPNHQAAAPQKAAANPHAQHRAAVTEQVNVQISKAIANGMDKISIQLRPAHLGRIDVQLEMASDGRVTAVVSADNKDTLDLLKQDSRELERAMREAGLQMGSGDLSFNLRENGGQTQGGEETAGRGLGSGPLTNEPTLDELLEASASRPNIISEDRVDITA